MAKRPVSEPPADVVLPITPMLDMAFQLLAFFVATYHPATMEGQMAVALPDKNITQAQNEQQIDIEQKPMTEEVPEPTFDLIVLLKPRDQLGENSLVLEEGQNRTPMTDLAALKRHLKGIVDRKKEGIEAEVKGLPPDQAEKKRKELLSQFGIKVQPTSAVKWGEMVEVMDACRLAGFTSVAFSKPGDYSL